MKATTQSPFITAADGTPLFYKDWGQGAPIVFLAAWSTSSDLWNYQTAPLCEAGFRCVAYDRRGHGRSGQPSGGYDYETLADDLAAVIDQLALEQVVLVGHSMAGGEIVRYLARHGSKHVDGVVLVAPTTPFLLQTDDNPHGVPRAVFDEVRAQWRQDYPKWLADNARAFFVETSSEAIIDWLVTMMAQTPLKVILDCNRAIIETDFRAELSNITTRTLVIHGDNDASAPLELTGRPTASLIPGARLIVYQGGPHGLMFTHAERLFRDLVGFIG